MAVSRKPVGFDLFLFFPHDRRLDFRTLLYLESHTDVFDACTLFLPKMACSVYFLLRFTTGCCVLTIFFLLLIKPGERVPPGQRQGHGRNRVPHPGVAGEAPTHALASGVSKGRQLSSLLPP